MAVQRGKAFERELKDAYQRAGAAPYRNPDAMYGQAASVKSLPDLWVFWSGGSVSLVECKATKAKSIPFNRLATHQADHLAMFDSFGHAYEGAVAVLFYNGERGHSRLARAFYIPIGEWLRLDRESGRRSLTLDAAAEYGVEYPWIPGSGWIVPRELVNPPVAERRS